MIKLNEELTSKQYIAVISSLAILFLLPMIISGSYYVDDVIRSNTGMLGWWDLGRPASDLVVSAISFNFIRSADVYPVTILLSCLANILTSCYLGKIFSIRHTITSALVCSLPTINSLYIQNMMYRYDCLPMSLSVLLAVYAQFVILNKRSYFLLFSPMALIASFMLYQPAAPSFVVLTIFLYAYNFENKLSYSTLIKSISSFAVSISSYTIYTKLAITTARSKLVFERPDWIDFMLGNASKLLDLYVRAYSYIGLSIILLLCIFCFVVYIKFIFISNPNRHKYRLLSLIMIPFPLYAFIASMILITVIAEWPAGPRVAIPFGFFCFGAMILFFKHIRFNGCFFVIPLFFVFSSIVTSAAASNAYGSQVRIDTSTALRITHQERFKSRNVFVGGRLQSSSIAINNEKSFPVIKDINFPANHWIMSLMLRANGVSKVVISGDVRKKEILTKKACEKGVIIEKVKYNICEMNGDVYVYLK